MTTPSDPISSDPQPVPAPVPAFAPTDEQVNALASQLADMVKLSFDPASVVKGVVTAVNSTNTPPDISLTLNGDTTVVTGVLAIDSYSPVVGDTVLTVKQGTSIFALGQLNDTGSGSANGWQTPALGSGFSTNGNANGPIQWRKVIDNGDYQIQWKGSVSHSGSTTTVVAAGGIPADSRPTATRTMIAARDDTGGSNAIKVNFNTDGSVTISGPNTVPNSGGATGSTSPGSTGAAGTGSTGTDSNNHNHVVGSDHTHSHGGAVIVTSFASTTSAIESAVHSHTGPSHTHTEAAHTHTMGALTVDAPVWISFNTLEYFL